MNVNEEFMGNNFDLGLHTPEHNKHIYTQGFDADKTLLLY